MTEHAATAIPPQATPEKPKAILSKTAVVSKLLFRAKGATLAEICNETSWQPHSARAFLSGLRKKGAVIVKEKRGDATCYRIEAAT